MAVDGHGRARLTDDCIPGEDQHQCKGTLVGHKGAIWMLQYDEEIVRLYSCCDDKKVFC
jgi:hypothetical protein